MLAGNVGCEPCAPMVECDNPDELFPVWLESVQTVLGEAGTPNVVAEAEAGEDAGAEFDKKNPYPATLLKSENLNKDGSSKATHHVEISLDGSDLEYEVGDALGVYPENSAKLIGEIIDAAIAR